MFKPGPTAFPIIGFFSGLISALIVIGLSTVWSMNIFLQSVLIGIFAAILSWAIDKWINGRSPEV